MFANPIWAILWPAWLFFAGMDIAAVMKQNLVARFEYEHRDQPLDPDEEPPWLI
jgi:hypothetical protein